MGFNAGGIFLSPISQTESYLLPIVILFKTSAFLKDPQIVKERQGKIQQQHV